MGRRYNARIRSFFFSNGAMYEGEWKNNMKHGFGIMKFEDGKKYIGRFEEDRIIDKDNQLTFEMVRNLLEEYNLNKINKINEIKEIKEEENADNNKVNNINNIYSIVQMKKNKEKSEANSAGVSPAKNNKNIKKLKSISTNKNNSKINPINSKDTSKINTSKIVQPNNKSKEKSSRKNSSNATEDKGQMKSNLRAINNVSNINISNNISIMGNTTKKFGNFDFFKN